LPSSIPDLAYQGQWARLLDALAIHPTQVDACREPKGYTPLHQAAWHGAPPNVIGRLLSLGADPNRRTASKQQTAHEIAIEKHPDRDDLRYLLQPRHLSIAQVLRQTLASTRELFGAYDGNQLLFDRLVACFDGAEFVGQHEGLCDRLDSAFRAIAGAEVTGHARVGVEFVGKSFDFQVDTAFWRDSFAPLLARRTAAQDWGPLEPAWAVVADLFDPTPEQWGLRGDLFLWLEMRRALAHVPLPTRADDLERQLHAAYETLMAQPLGLRAQVFVDRFARGGMSSGMVDGEFWARVLVPSLCQRLQWLRASWAGKSGGVERKLGAPVDAASPVLSTTLKRPGDSTMRVIATLAGFRARHGRWPDTVDIDARLLAALATELLTPLGFFRLQSTLEVTTHVSGTVVARSSGDQGMLRFEYGESSPSPEVSSAEVAAWLGWDDPGSASLAEAFWAGKLSKH